MELKGVIEISSRSIKYIWPHNGKPQKNTSLLKKTPMNNPSSDVYSEIKEKVRMIIKTHKKICFRRCALTGSFSKEPLSSSVANSLAGDFGLDVEILSAEEQLDYSYHSFIQNEKGHRVSRESDDIFIEISEQSIFIGLYRDGERIESTELNTGLKKIRELFNNRCTGNASARYSIVRDFFENKGDYYYIKQLELNPSDNCRVIIAGGSAKSLVGGQEPSKHIQGKVYSSSIIDRKVDTFLSKMNECYPDNPEMIWENTNYSKLMNGVLASIYIYALMERFGVESAVYSGFGVIDSFFYKTLGKTRHFRFPELLKALTAHQNVFISGPTGAGKTFAAEQCAKKLKCDLYFTGAISNEYKLLGYMDANGNYVSTEFRKAYENGGLFLFDEVDASYPQPLLAFNAALSGDQMDFPDKTVKKHKDFFCIATANTYGSGSSRQYVGRNQLDAAFLDRFVFIDWPYDEELERNMTENQEWVNYVLKVRAAIDKLGVGKMGLRHIVSPRATISGASLLKAGLERERVEEMVIWKGLERETVRMIKNNMD